MDNACVRKDIDDITELLNVKTLTDHNMNSFNSSLHP